MGFQARDLEVGGQEKRITGCKPVVRNPLGEQFKKSWECKRIRQA